MTFFTENNIKLWQNEALAWVVSTYRAKVKEISNKLCCCYGNLLCKNDDHNLLTNE